MNLSLNRVQRAILVVAAILLIVLFFCPPWCDIKVSHGGKVQSIGNQPWIGVGPPRSNNPACATAIDTTLLGYEILIIIGSAALLFVAAYSIGQQSRKTKI